MSSEKFCKSCSEILPVDALYVLNRIAIKRGYCNWPCLTKALSPEEVDKMLRDRRNKAKKK